MLTLAVVLSFLDKFKLYIIGIIIGIIVLFIYFNTESIGESIFGIDSKATLKAKAVTLDAGLTQCKQTNIELNKTITQAETICKTKLDTISELNKEKIKIDDSTNVIINNRKKAVAGIKLKATNSNTPVDGSKIAQVNINSLWAAYCQDEEFSVCRGQ